MYLTIILRKNWIPLLPQPEVNIISLFVKKVNGMFFKFGSTKYTIHQNFNSWKKKLNLEKVIRKFWELRIVLIFFAEYSPLPSAQIQQCIRLGSDGSTWIFQAKLGDNVLESGFIPSYEELENYFTTCPSKFLRYRKEIWLWKSSKILTGDVDENKMKCYLSALLYLIWYTF